VNGVITCFGMGGTLRSKAWPRSLKAPKPFGCGIDAGNIRFEFDVT